MQHKKKEEYGIDENWRVYPLHRRRKHKAPSEDTSATLLGSIGLREIIGKRPTQEDAYTVFAADEVVNHLSKGLLQAVYEKTFLSLNESLERQLQLKVDSLEEDKRHGVNGATVYCSTEDTRVDGKLAGGSCALITHAAGYLDEDKKMHVEAHAAWVGDSVSFLLVIDDRTGKVNYKKSRVLNRLHDGNNSQECERVLKEGGTIENYRVVHPGGSIAVTRSVGDRTVMDKKKGLLAVFHEPTKGLSQIPECSDHQVVLEPHERAFILASCDGLLENVLISRYFNFRLDSSTESDLENMKEKICAWLAFIIENENYSFDNFDPQKFAEMLVLHAYLGDHKQVYLRDTEEKVNLGSSDNITCMVKEILPDEPAHFMAIFDGHGGDGVAKFLEAEFEETFKNHLQAELTERRDIIMQRLVDYVEEHKNEQASVYQKKTSFVLGLLREWKVHPDKNFLQVLQNVFNQYLQSENIIQVFGRHKHKKRSAFVESISGHQFTRGENLLIDCLELGIGCDKKEAKKILNKMREEPVQADQQAMPAIQEEKWDEQEANFVDAFDEALRACHNADSALIICTDRHPLWEFCQLDRYTDVHAYLLRQGVSAQLIDDMLLRGIRNGEIPWVVPEGNAPRL